MRNLFVGVCDAKVSREADTSLVTYALASCVGVAIYDSAAVVGGLLHYMLPDSRIDPEKAKEHPWMFADIAIPMFFQRAYRLGAEKTRLRVIVAGGAQVLQSTDSLEIGKQNLLAMRRIFRKSGVPLNAEDVGGSDIRTLRLEIGTGRLTVNRSRSGERELGSHADVNR
jgi:chemotaxis protein CheD